MVFASPDSRMSHKEGDKPKRYESFVLKFVARACHKKVELYCNEAIPVMNKYVDANLPKLCTINSYMCIGTQSSAQGFLVQVRVAI